MTPYLALRAQGGLGRPLDWVEQYSATAASWVTATPWLRLHHRWVGGDPSAP